MRVKMCSGHLYTLGIIQELQLIDSRKIEFKNRGDNVNNDPVCFKFNFQAKELASMSLFLLA